MRLGASEIDTHLTRTQTGTSLPPFEANGTTIVIIEKCITPYDMPQMQDIETRSEKALTPQPHIDMIACKTYEHLGPESKCLTSRGRFAPYL